MSIPFQGSRLANLREKRPSQVEKTPFIRTLFILFRITLEGIDTSRLIRHFISAFND